MDGKNQFKLKDEYGNETVYDVLFTLIMKRLIKVISLILIIV